MEKQEFTLEGTDNEKLFCSIYPADIEKSALLVIHGMAEHSGRYADFAAWMAAEGISVFTFDLRGHGKTAGSLGKLGHFADKAGWNVVMNDTGVVVNHFRKTFPDVPKFIFGHSMGSLIARSLLKHPMQDIQGVILSGTTHDPGFLTKAGIALAKIGGRIHGYKKHSNIHNKLTFGRFNKPFTTGTSDYEWLSRDMEKVKLYEEDLYCGFLCTMGFYRDMFTGLQKLYKRPDAQDNFTIPLLLLSGENDPVGNFGQDVEKVYNWYVKQGYSYVKQLMYPGARHELLNEINRKEVFRDILAWIDHQIPAD